MKNMSMALLAVAVAMVSARAEETVKDDDNRTIVIERRVIEIPRIEIDMSGLHEGLAQAREGLNAARDYLKEIRVEQIDRNHGRFSELRNWEDWTYAQASSAGNARNVDETKPCDPDADVYIKNISGSVKVIGWDRNETRVTGSIGEDVERFEFDADEDDVEIRVIVPRNTRNAKIRTELTINVPRGARLEVDTVAAPIDVRDLTGDDHELKSVSGSIEVVNCDGEFELHTISGSIDHHDARADVEAESVSGSVEIGGSAGEVKAESVSGQVRVFGARDSIDAESVSGSVRVESEGAEDVEMNTVSGSIRFTGSVRDGGEIYAKSISGSVELTLSEVAGRYELQTFSGSIRNGFGPSPERTSKHGPGRELRFTEGDGNRRINAESFSGSVRLERK